MSMQNRYWIIKVIYRASYSSLLTKLAIIVLILTAPTWLYGQPILDATLRPGEPLYARLQLPPSLVRDEEGYLRTPNVEEAISQGFEWTRLLASLEIVPRVGSAGGFYLTTQEPVPQGLVEILLVWESIDTLTFLPFRGERVNGSVQIEALAQRVVAVSLSERQEVMNSPTDIDFEERRNNRNDEQAVAPRERREAQTPVTSPDPVSTTNDELTEKLRRLLEDQRQEAIDQEEISQEAMRQDDVRLETINELASDENNSVAVTGTIGSEDSPDSQTQQNVDARVSTRLGSAERPTATQSLLLREEDMITVVPTAEMIRGEQRLESSLFDLQVSLASLFQFLILSWFLIVSGYLFKKQLGNTNNTAQTGNEDVPQAPRGNQAVGGAGQAATAVLPQTSVFSQVLREAAAQAEAKDLLDYQSRLDRERAQIAEIQGKALFEYAQKMQGAVEQNTAPSFSANNIQPEPRSENETTKPAFSQPESTVKQAKPAEEVSRQTADNKPLSNSGTPQPRPAQLRTQTPTMPAGAARLMRNTKETVKPVTSPVAQAGEGSLRGEKDSATAKPEPAPVHGEQLSLALVYMNMGENDTARSLLEDIAKNGSESDKKEAQKILREMNDE